VPHFSESIIQNLCSEALTVTSQHDIDRVIGKLRAALEEHIRAAKESLIEQAATISALESEKSQAS